MWTACENNLKCFTGFTCFSYDFYIVFHRLFHRCVKIPVEKNAVKTMWNGLPLIHIVFPTLLCEITMWECKVFAQNYHVWCERRANLWKILWNGHMKSQNMCNDLYKTDPLFRNIESVNANKQPENLVWIAQDAVYSPLLVHANLYDVNRLVNFYLWNSLVWSVICHSFVQVVSHQYIMFLSKLEWSEFKFSSQYQYTVEKTVDKNKENCQQGVVFDVAWNSWNLQ